TVQALEPEVVKHEPALALDGGEDGLNAIRRLVEETPDYVQPGGFCLMEMMAGQGPAVETLMRQRSAFDPVQIHLDLAGLDRFGLGVRI
ncbi:MAG TPA: protein-(glutamine-N5) methyltransferase, release factor-specific, partial [Trichocoleus sp.]